MRTFYRGMGEKDFIKWKKHKYIPKGVFVTPTEATAIDYTLMWADDVKHNRIAGIRQALVVIVIQIADGEYDGTWKDAKHFGETQLLCKVPIKRVKEIIYLEEMS